MTADSIKIGLTFSILLLVIILISGCVETKVSDVIKTLPELQSFLESHPDAQITVVLWNSDYIKSNIDRIPADCVQGMDTSKDYYKATIYAANITIITWLDKGTNNAVCILKDGVSLKLTESITIDEKIVCNTPYIRIADSCCLDQNSNSICDNDEMAVKSTCITTDKNQVAEDTLSYLNTNFGTSAVLNDVDEISSVYKININTNGDNTDVYATQDGAIIFPVSIDTNRTVAGNKDTIAYSTVAFLNNNFSTTSTLKNVSEVNCVYKIALDVDGDITYVYTSIDGRLIFPTAIDVEAQPKIQSTSEKPVVELFVMSHCPYGLQTEKGILPVVELLGDKIDFEVKFVYYAMQGKTELDEELVQYCIQKDFSSKYLDYLSCFVEEGDTQGCIDENNIDSDDLYDCVAETDETYDVTELYNNMDTWISGRFPQMNIYKADNEKYSIDGSPTLIIDGVETSSSRDSASLLSAICSKFTSQPYECSRTLSAATPSAGFG
jgi:hypothetical protein